jgi:hypothetical protein
MESPAGEDFDYHHGGSQRDHSPGVLLGYAAICSIVVAVRIAGDVFWFHGL